MGYQRERDEFIVKASQEGLSLPTIHKLLRYSTTLHRLAEAQCNGDWPYNGSRDNYLHKAEGDPNGKQWQAKNFGECSECESECAKSQLRRKVYMDEGPGGRKYYRGVCPDCRTQELVRELLRSIDPGCDCGNEDKFRPIFQGDPRGAVLRLSTPRHPWTEDGSGGRRGLVVPAGVGRGR